MAQKNSFWKEYMQKGLSEKSLGALYFVIMVPCIIFFIQGINARIGLSFLNPNIRIEIYSLLAILSIHKIYRVLTIWDYLFVMCLGVFCLYVSPSLYPETTPAVKMFGPYFVYSCLPLYFVGRTIKLDKDYDLLIYIGRFGTILNAFLFFLVTSKVMTHMTSSEEENMFMAYASLPSVIIVSCSELRRHNMTDLLLSLLGAVLLLSFGTRGPVLAYAFFVGLYLLFFKDAKNAFRKNVIILFLLVLVSYLAYNTSILEMIVSFFGGSTRVFEHMQGGSLVNYDNRDWIYQEVIFQLSKGEKLGYGFFYDRTIFGMEQGSYCHNLFLEFWLDFGYYIGSFLIIILMCMILYIFIMNKEKQSRQLYLALICALVVQLFFSSSYLESPNFWLFIGLTVASIIDIKRKKYIQKS